MEDAWLLESFRSLNLCHYLPPWQPIQLILEPTGRRLKTRSPQESATTQIQIATCEIDERAVGILGQTFVPHHAEAEDAFADLKDMLDGMTHARFCSIDATLIVGQAFGTWRSRLREVGSVRSLVTNNVSFSAVRAS